MVDFVLSTDSAGSSRGFGWATYSSYENACEALKSLSGFNLSFLFYLGFITCRVAFSRIGPFSLFCTWERNFI
jgi:hypothetical protein